ncbi:LytTR family DNA-binding domain-containing protein [Actinomycetaceae bacterium MB13-C1-2]|nr:LytTR family DNA-binding domain-containing protein [Actinomycetaceae bacterium MB13-C1-2]
MLRVAIVEDDSDSAALLVRCLERSLGEREIQFECTIFSEATSFLTSYKPVFDLVFMDIELPILSGMEAARRLRRLDSKVLLIFVTSMSHFAEQGYEVDAFDFISKPYRFADFDRKLGRALKARNRELDSMLVSQRGTQTRLLLRDISCIEARGHSLRIHVDGQILDASGSLREMQEALQGKGFLRANKSFIVNGRFVKVVRDNRVTLSDGNELTIGRPYRKPFLDGLAMHISEGER